MMTGVKRLLLSAFTSLFVLLMIACEPRREATPLPPNCPVTILGLDGATWRIIDPLIERGELPGFAALKKNGSYGWLKTFVPTESVSIWTSIATGMTPTHHGIQTFTRRIPGTDETVPSPSTDRMVPAIWNIVSDAGKTVVCVKWFATWPAEKVNGAMLSPRLEEDAGGQQTYPPELFKEISPFRYKSTMDKLPRPHRRNIPLLTQPKGPPPPGMLIGQNQVKTKMFDDTSVWEAGKFVFERYHPDLFMIYLKSIDRVEHFLWSAHSVLYDPQPTKAQLEDAEAIFGWYRYFDGIIQELLQDPNRILIVVSDHGMKARKDIPEPYDARSIDMDRVLVALGYQERENGKTVWSRTQAYVYRKLPYDWRFRISINTEGREPKGIITPENAALKTEEIAQTLDRLWTADGKKVFARVITQSVSGQHWEIECELNRNLSLDDELVLKKRRVTVRSLLDTKGLPEGIHTDAPPGIIAVAGPGINRGHRIDGATVFDITPTVLWAMGLPVASDFDGKPIRSIFTGEVLRTNPVKQIKSYGKRHVKSGLKKTRADERMKKELRALGYIK